MVATTAQVLGRPTVESARHMTTGQVLRGQAKFAAIAYPALMALAFVGAIGAAYVNPRLLDPVETERPAQTQPTVQQEPVFLAPQPSKAPARIAPRTETEPLVSQYEYGRDVGAAVSAANHAEATGATMPAMPGVSVRAIRGQVEVCEDQATSGGHVLGRTCTRHDAASPGLATAPR